MSENRTEVIEDYRNPLKDALGRAIPLEGDLRVWLDDELVKREAPEGWIHLRTAREVCLILLTGRVVELSLDNDLGDSHSYDDDGQLIPDDEKLEGRIEFGVGYQVIDFLEHLHGTEGRALWPSEAINLHTSNPSGRKQMADAIENLAQSVGAEVVSTEPGGQPRFVITLPGGEE